MRVRSRFQFGTLTLAVVCLLGMVALQAASASPSRAAAAAVPWTSAQRSARSSRATAYANPAVVRVLTYYFGTTRGGDAIEVPVACADTGVLVGTTGQNSFNYVLTASSAVNALAPCEGAQAAFQQLNGAASGWGILRVEVWLSESYTGDGAKALGSIRYTIDATRIANVGGPYAPKLVALPLQAPSGAPNHDLPVLQTPQPSDPPAGADLTVLDLSRAGEQPLGHDALLTSEVPAALYPVAVDASQFNQVVLPTPTKPPTPTPPQQTVVGGTVVPTHAPASSPTSQAAPTTLSAEISVGAPVVNSNGALVGMVIADTNGAHVIAPLSLVTQAIGPISGKPGTIMQQWQQGISALYATPPNFTAAATAFTALSASAADFGGVAPFASAAKEKTTNVVLPGAAPSPTATAGPSTPPTGSGGLSLPILVAAVALVLFAIILVVVLVVLRSLKGRRQPGPTPPDAPRGNRTPRLAPRASASLPKPDLWTVPQADAVETQPHRSLPGGAAVSAPPRPASAGPAIEDVSTAVMPAAHAANAPMSRGAILVPQAAGLTDPGRRRSTEPNQDNILALTGTHLVHGRPQPYGLFIIADGMGGHTDGKEASRRTIEVVAGHIVPALNSGQPLTSAQLGALLREGAMKANADLREQNLTRRADMGTTLTAALVLGDMAYIANVGDSRTYVLNPDTGLRQITTDHSVVASLVSAGVIRPEDAYTHPRRNQIYRSLGGQHEDTDVDLFQVVLEAGDRLLLCSDGLWEMVRDPQIESILRNAADPRQATELLIQEANNNGGEDNISVIVVRMLDDHAAFQPRPGVQVVAGSPETMLPDQG